MELIVRVLREDSPYPRVQGIHRHNKLLCGVSVDKHRSVSKQNLKLGESLL